MIDLDIDIEIDVSQQELIPPQDSSQSSNGNDNDFGSSSEEQDPPGQLHRNPEVQQQTTEVLPDFPPNIDQVDFKQMMRIAKQIKPATIDEQKKRNLIDKPLAEIEESDSDEEKQARQTEAFKSRFAKLNQMVDETTQEFRQNEKQQARDKQTAKLQKRALEDWLRVEKSRAKFRTSASGGVFINQLKRGLEIKQINAAAPVDAIQPDIPALPTIVAPVIAEDIPSAVSIEEIKIEADVDPQPVKTKVKKVKKKPVPVEPVQLRKIPEPIQQENIDWDNLQAKPIEQLSEQQEQLDLELRRTPITTEQAYFYLLSQDISKELFMTKGSRHEAPSLVQKAFSCLKQQHYLDKALVHQRDDVFALTKVKLQTSISEHDRTIKTIYRALTQQEKCPSTGSHWQQIGFQATDPAQDVRGCGMLGVLHLLHFTELLPVSSKLILNYAQQPQCHFPVAIKLFEFTQAGLGLLRQGKLFRQCNKQFNVKQTLSLMVISMFIRFCFLYISQRADINEIQRIASQVLLEAQKGRVDAAVEEDAVVKARLQTALDGAQQHSGPPRDGFSQI